MVYPPDSAEASRNQGGWQPRLVRNWMRGISASMASAVASFRSIAAPTQHRNGAATASRLGRRTRTGTEIAVGIRSFHRMGEMHEKYGKAALFGQYRKKRGGNGRFASRERRKGKMAR